MESIGLGLGRLLLSVIFILSGVQKLMHFSQTASMMAGKGIPLATVALALSIAVEVGGGLLLIIGYKVRYVAMVMALFLVPVTLTFHNFWAFQGAAREMQMVNFLKNLAIMGGLLVAAFSSRASSERAR
jgi:putative oxidoreductase